MQKTMPQPATKEDLRELCQFVKAAHQKMERDLTICFAIMFALCLLLLDSVP